MASFRDIKRKARRDLHREMQVPALYLSTPDAEPLPVHVRIHTKFEALGDQKGTNFRAAEMIERQPMIVFMRDEVAQPRRNAIVSVEPGEAYRLGVSAPPDDITISVYVTPLLPSELGGLPIPELP